MKFTPDEQAAQLRKPQGEGAVHIMDYMNRGNQILYPKALEAMQLKPQMQVLELGQGNGPLVHLILAGAVGVRYTGLDYSGDSVRLAKEKNEVFVQNGTANFHEGIIADMPFADNTFDRILGINIIYFLENLQKEMGEIFRVMKSGSLLVLGYRPKDKLSKMPFTQKGFIHYHPRDLENLLRKSGFQNVISERFREPDRMIDGQRFTMDSVVTTAKKPG